MSNNNYTKDGTETIDFTRIRELNPLLEYCQDHGFELRRSGNRWVGKCPLHNELNGEAFVIHPDEKWQCYGKCGRSGDVTDLEQALYGGTLAEAAARLGAMAPIGASTTVSVSMLPIGNAEIPRFVVSNQEFDSRVRQSRTLPTASNPLALPYVLTAEEIQRCQRYALRILQDHEYLQRVAKARQWQQETLHDLALDGYLGRDDEDHICFISASGCKSRWLENGERRFRFLFGRSWLWRGELIPGTQTVYLCEGETDVISLIDRGIEDDGETIAVVRGSAVFDGEAFRKIEGMVWADPGFGQSMPANG
jgi:hypothetical protein